MTDHVTPLRPDLPLTLSEAGEGRPALILHGGGGPATVTMIANHLAGTMRTITPIHPGWNGTERPGSITGIDELAMLYLDYLDAHDLRDVVVIGSSLGGWIGAEMAVRDLGRRITGLVLIDAVGIDVDGEPITDFFALDPRGIAEHSYHNPDRFFTEPSTIPPEDVALRQANVATMKLLAGDPYMHDPKLLHRLERVRVPALVVWGDSDKIVTPAYGRAYAAAFANARFEVVPDAGHLPQVEQSAATFALIDAYLR